MEIYVNDIRVELAKGMTVRHALIAAFGPQTSFEHLSARDRWGNLVALDGALSEGERIEAVAISGDKHD